jgi:hypothetical protein
MISNGKDPANITMELKMVSPVDRAKDVKVKQHGITQGGTQLASGPSNSQS